MTQDHLVHSTEPVNGSESRAEVKPKRGAFVPETPAGTPLLHLKAKTEERAWAKLLRDAAHMPYRGVEGFKKRGYKVLFWEEQ